MCIILFLISHSPHSNTLTLQSKGLIGKKSYEHLSLKELSKTRPIKPITVCSINRMKNLRDYCISIYQTYCISSFEKSLIKCDTIHIKQMPKWNLYKVTPFLTETLFFVTLKNVEIKELNH